MNNSGNINYPSHTVALCHFEGLNEAVRNITIKVNCCMSESLKLLALTAKWRYYCQIFYAWKGVMAFLPTFCPTLLNLFNMRTTHANCLLQIMLRSVMWGLYCTWELRLKYVLFSELGELIIDFSWGGSPFVFISLSTISYWCLNCYIFAFIRVKCTTVFV